MRYHARWVLPITQPPIENGTVVEADGVITFVGPRADAPAGRDYDLGEAILLPGLVNTHTHLELTAMRGFLEDCRFAEWIDKLRQSRNEVLDAEMLLDAARSGVLEGVEAGITTYADTCSTGVAMQAMRELGVRGVMYQEVFGPDPSRADTAMGELESVVDRLQLEQTELVSLGVSPHAPYTVSDALYEAAAHFANSRKLPLPMHVAERHRLRFGRKQQSNGRARRSAARRTNPSSRYPTPRCIRRAPGARVGNDRRRPRSRSRIAYRILGDWQGCGPRRVSD